MAPIFKTIALLAVAILPTALVSANCVANILNFNSAVVGSGCIPAGGEANVKANGVTYAISATSACGLGMATGQRLPSGWSLAGGGRC